jgi:hypothetical protein
MQQVLTRPHWVERLTATDLRSVTLLIWEHVNPYRRFELDIARLDLSPNGPRVTRLLREPLFVCDV